MLAQGKSACLPCTRPWVPSQHCREKMKKITAFFRDQVAQWGSNDKEAPNTALLSQGVCCLSVSAHHMEGLSLRKENIHVKPSVVIFCLCATTAFYGTPN